MALYVVLTEAQLAEAMRGFGLPPPVRVTPEPRGGENSNYHVWSGGERFFLRVNEGKADADVAFEAEVLRHLAEARFPAPQLVPAADGAPFARVAGRQALLFRYAAGEERGAAGAGAAACRRVGEQLARLHEVGAGFPGDRPSPYGPPRVGKWLADLSGPASRGGGGPGATGASGGDGEVAAALPLLHEELERARALPGAPRGLVHGDLFRDNVLWIGDRIGTVLDWEMACTDAFAYDVGVALCAWAYLDRFDGERAAALVAGYRARRRVEPETLDGLHAWTRYAALRFTVSRIHGYHRAALGAERLVKKDWRRFRDRLVALRALGEAGFRGLVGL